MRHRPLETDNAPLACVYADTLANANIIDDATPFCIGASRYDQTAIDFDGNLKLVDVKSLRHLEWTENHERRNYKSGTTCTHGSTCKKCMKMAANLTSEHSCDHASKKCHGYAQRMHARPAT